MKAEYLEELLLKKQHDTNICRVLQMKCEPAVAGGQNYLSSVMRVTADVLLGSGDKRTITVIVKNDAEPGPVCDILAGLSLFDSEIMLYTHILHGMEELMVEFNDKRGPFWSDIYGHRKDLIVFEDLKASGFVSANRCNGFDLEHTKMIIRNLARFHAMSKVLLTRKYFSPDDLRPYPIIGNMEFAEKVYGNGLRVLAKEMREWEPEWKEISDRIEKCGDVVAQKMLALSKVDEKKFNVMNHGDCWICNLMFKYEPFENRPVEMRLLDYQFCHYQSYAWDLTFFMCTSLLGDFRRKHYEDIILEYATALRENLLFFNYTGNDIPTFDDVKKEMEYCQDLQIPFILITHPLMTAPVQSPINFEEVLTTKLYCKSNCGFNVDMFRVRYKDEIGPDIKRFAECGMI